MDYKYHIFYEFARNLTLFGGIIMNFDIHVLLKPSDTLAKDIGKIKCEI
jgi:hypothetical protein